MEPDRFPSGKSNHENVALAGPLLSESEKSSVAVSESASQRCNSFHFQNSEQLQSLSNKPLISESVNWSLYADKLREAVSGLETLGKKCFLELETVSPSSQEHFSSHLLSSKMNSVRSVPKSLNSTPVAPNRTNFSFGKQTKILSCERKDGRQLNINELPVLNCDRLSHSTIRQLASLHYLQSPPTKYDTITCTVKDTECVLGKKDGEVLELIEEGWAEPVFLGNDRELKKQTHGLLGK